MQDAATDLPKKSSATETAVDESEASFLDDSVAEESQTFAESFIEEEAEEPDAQTDAPAAKPDAEPAAKASVLATHLLNAHLVASIRTLIHIFVFMFAQEKAESPKAKKEEKEDSGGDDDGITNPSDYSNGIPTYLMMCVRSQVLTEMIGVIRILMMVQYLWKKKFCPKTRIFSNA